MTDCPHDPRCPYCGDTGEWERRMEELDEQARIDAHRREWDPEDMFPDDMIDNPPPPRERDDLDEADDDDLQNWLESR